MSRLLETIKIKDREILNIGFHNKRANTTRRNLFGSKDEIDLMDFIHLPDFVRRGIYKCRIIYNQQIQSIEFQRYQKKIINSLKIIKSDKIVYNYKFEDRMCLQELLMQKGQCDDVLIVKNNLITDISFANIVFFDGDNWITPATTLLKGTKREKLLQEKVIFEDEIKLSDLRIFKHACIINAMLELNDIVIKIENIL